MPDSESEQAAKAPRMRRTQSHASSISNHSGDGYLAPPSPRSPSGLSSQHKRASSPTEEEEARDMLVALPSPSAIAERSPGIRAVGSSNSRRKPGPDESPSGSSASASTTSSPSLNSESSNSPDRQPVSVITSVPAVPDDPATATGSGVDVYRPYPVTSKHSPSLMAAITASATGTVPPSTLPPRSPPPPAAVPPTPNAGLKDSAKKRGKTTKRTPPSPRTSSRRVADANAKDSPSSKTDSSRSRSTRARIEISPGIVASPGTDAVDVIDRNAALTAAAASPESAAESTEVNYDDSPEIAATRAGRKTSISAPKPPPGVVEWQGSPSWAPESSFLTSPESSATPSPPGAVVPVEPLNAFISEEDLSKPSTPSSTQEAPPSGGVVSWKGSPDWDASPEQTSSGETNPHVPGRMRSGSSLSTDTSNSSGGTKPPVQSPLRHEISDVEEADEDGDLLKISPMVLNPSSTEVSPEADARDEVVHSDNEELVRENDDEDAESTHSSIDETDSQPGGHAGTFGARTPFDGPADTSFMSDESLPTRSQNHHVTFSEDASSPSTNGDHSWNDARVVQSRHRHRNAAPLPDMLISPLALPVTGLDTPLRLPEISPAVLSSLRTPMRYGEPLPELPGSPLLDEDGNFQLPSAEMKPTNIKLRNKRDRRGSVRRETDSVSRSGGSSGRSGPSPGSFVAGHGYPMQVNQTVFFTQTMATPYLIARRRPDGQTYYEQYMAPHQNTAAFQTRASSRHHKERRTPRVEAIEDDNDDVPSLHVDSDRDSEAASDYVESPVVHRQHQRRRNKRREVTPKITPLSDPEPEADDNADVPSLHVDSDRESQWESDSEPHEEVTPPSMEPSPAINEKSHARRGTDASEYSQLPVDYNRYRGDDSVAEFVDRYGDDRERDSEQIDDMGRRDDEPHPYQADPPHPYQSDPPQVDFDEESEKKAKLQARKMYHGNLQRMAEEGASPFSRQSDRITAFNILDNASAPPKPSDSIDASVQPMAHQYKAHCCQDDGVARPPFVTPLRLRKLCLMKHSVAVRFITLCLVELLGTAIFSLLIAKARLGHFLNPVSTDTASIDMAYGCAVALLLLISGLVPRATFHPVFTLVLAGTRNLRWYFVPPILLFQFIGSYVGTLVAVLSDWDLLHTSTVDQAAISFVSGMTAAREARFQVLPEFVPDTLLALTICMLWRYHAHTINKAAISALAVFGISAAFASDGWTISPMRDLGARLVCTTVSSSASCWSAPTTLNGFFTPILGISFGLGIFVIFLLQMPVASPQSVRSSNFSC